MTLGGTEAEIGPVDAGLLAEPTATALSRTTWCGGELDVPSHGRLRHHRVHLTDHDDVGRGTIDLAVHS